MFNKNNHTNNNPAFVTSPLVNLSQKQKPRVSPQRPYMTEKDDKKSKGDPAHVRLKKYEDYLKKNEKPLHKVARRIFNVANSSRYVHDVVTGETDLFEMPRGFKTADGKHYIKMKDIPKAIRDGDGNNNNNNNNRGGGGNEGEGGDWNDIDYDPFQKIGEDGEYDDSVWTDHISLGYDDLPEALNKPYDFSRHGRKKKLEYLKKVVNDFKNRKNVSSVSREDYYPDDEELD